jgi:transcriptional regulator with XRE-family HTH domain
VVGNGDIAEIGVPKPAATTLTGSRRTNCVDALVGGRIRARRSLLGMSQDQLAQRLDLSLQQIQKYEKGINRIGASRLFHIGKALGVSVQYFYEGVAPHLPGTNGAADPTIEAPIISFLRSPDGVELNRAFARIANPKMRRAIVELARSLASQELPPKREAET